MGKSSNQDPDRLPPFTNALGSVQGELVERLLAAVAARLASPVAFSLQVLNRRPLHLGDGSPRFSIRLLTQRAVLATLLLSEIRIGEAFLDQEIDIDGDFAEALRLRSRLGDLGPLFHLWSTYAKPLLFGQERQDEAAIAEHYDEDPSFYCTFLDARWRCYSHGYFARDEEPLADAITRKLDTALTAVGCKPGDRVLDIGAGWGAFSEFAGERGVHVTSLTISAKSEEYVRELIARRSLPCRVVRRHFLEYQDERPFDAIVNLGVTEHLPDYAATASQYARLVKPGGRIFLDACASRRKFPFSSFVKKHVWPGNATPLVLADYLGVMLRAGLEVKQVTDDRQNYYLTAYNWAKNLENARAEIVQRFGERKYRRFRLYLWGCAHGFATRNLGAYHLLLERPRDSYATEHFSNAWARVPFAPLLRPVRLAR